MSERAEDKRLQELRDKGITVYSISRLDTINRCLAEAYKTYVLHERGRDSIYAKMGTRLHDTLEKIANGEADESSLLPAMNDELEDMQLCGLEFPKDREGNDTIRDNWIKDITHFCSTFHMPRGKKLKTEELFLYTTPSGHILQGYIDLQHELNDGSIAIYDWKSSSIYKGSDLKDHARQLILYALGKEQEGYTVRSISWVFLKFVRVTFQGYKTSKSKQKTEIVKDIERRKIYAELEKYFQKDLEEMGMDEFDISVTLDNIKQEIYNNGQIPEILRDKYKMRPCVVSVELTEENRNECIDYIENTIKLWESLDSDDEKSYPPLKFTKLKASDGTEALSMFYCINLCSHFNTCNYAKDFLDQWSANNQGDDLF